MTRTIFGKRNLTNFRPSFFFRRCLREKQLMPRTWKKSVADDTRVDDPELVEKVAIAIFERPQGSWEYAREAEREWLRLEAQAAIATFLEHVEEHETSARSVQTPRAPISLG